MAEGFLRTRRPKTAQQAASQAANQQLHRSQVAACFCPRLVLRLSGDHGSHELESLEREFLWDAILPLVYGVQLWLAAIRGRGRTGLPWSMAQTGPSPIFISEETMFKNTVDTLRDVYSISIANSGPGSTILYDLTETPKKKLGQFNYAQLGHAERNGGAAGVARLVGREPIPGTGVAMPTSLEQTSPYVQKGEGRLPEVDPNQPIQTQLARLQSQAKPGSELEADLAAAQEGIGATPEGFMQQQRAARAQPETPAPTPVSDATSSEGADAAAGSETDFMEPEK